jgi:hypothetical protein
MCDDNVGTLLERTRALLAQTDQTYVEIYTATQLDPNWLSALLRGKIADPSVNKVQRLYEHLTQRKLAV